MSNEIRGTPRVISRIILGAVGDRLIWKYCVRQVRDLPRIGMAEPRTESLVSGRGIHGESDFRVVSCEFVDHSYLRRVHDPRNHTK